MEVEAEIKKYNEEKAQLLGKIKEYEKHVQVHTHQIDEHEHQHVMLNKHIQDKDRLLKILSRQNTEMSDEMEAMAKADVLIRQRLNRKTYFEKVNDYNENRVKES